MTSDGSSGEYSSDEEYSEDMTEDSEDFSDDTSDLSDDEELTEESIISSEESSKNFFRKKFSLFILGGMILLCLISRMTPFPESRNEFREIRD